MKDYKWHKSELFPGAWVMNEMGEFAEIVDANENQAVVRIGKLFEDWCTTGQYEPIPITPEILERAGFKPWENGFAIGPHTVYLADDLNDVWGYEFGLYNVLITHFHELQVRILWDSRREILLTLETNNG